MARRPPPRPAPRTPVWVWIGLVAVVAAIAGLGYWAFYIPWSAR